MYIITSYEEFEDCFGEKASKNRKLYNGTLKCYLYQYIRKFREDVDREKINIEKEKKQGMKKLKKEVENKSKKVETNPFSKFIKKGRR